MKNIYVKKGYKNQKDYFNSVAEEYGIPVDYVCAINQILGDNEDFDGLISIIEDTIN